MAEVVFHDVRLNCGKAKLNLSVGCVKMRGTHKVSGGSACAYEV